MLVSEVMTPRPVTIRPDASVKAALETLAVRGVTSLPVLDGREELVGVVSEADLVRHLVPLDRRAHLLPVVTDPDRPRLVAEVMTAVPVTVRPETDVAEAADLFSSTGVKCLPVLDERGLLVGVLSRSDVVRVLARADEDLRHEVARVLAELGLDASAVDVHDGVAEVPGDDGDLAARAAASVPGVLRVTHRPAS